VDIAEELRHAVAVAKADAEPHACVSRFLTREFGKRNATFLLRDAPGAVSQLHKAHRAVKLALGRWDGSPKRTERLVRATYSYMERMEKVCLLCNTPHIRPTIQKTMIERRNERAAYYRNRRAQKPGDASL